MKKNLLWFILGGLFFSSITAGAAYVYTASDIGYQPSDENWNVTNASEAISSLKDDLNTVNTNVTEYKQQITGALANKGVEVNENSTMEEITNGIDSINPGSLKRVKVGTVTAGWSDSTKTIDCKSISNYQNLTISNFTYEYTFIQGAGNGGRANCSPSMSYNASTGVLTLSGLSVAGSGWNGIESASITVYVYYVE